MIQDYIGIFLFLLAGIAFVGGGLLTARLVRPNRPNPEKNTTYETGEDPTQNSWGNYNIRFYLVALIFIIFEAEIIFLFPWATMFVDKQLIAQTNGLWAWFSFVEVLVFVLVLALGLAYLWKKGYLDWDRPNIKKIESKNTVPSELYQHINQKYK